MKKRIRIYCVILLLLLSSGCGSGTLLYGTDSGEEPFVSALPKESTMEPDSESAADKPQKIWVDVCGEVKHPGVYSLEENSRVFEAVEAAGGFTGEADTRSLNQAEFLCDGQKLTVLSREEASKRQIEQNTGGTEDDGRVNLNKAAKSELMSLPGIGEVRAEAILAYRDAHGGFDSIEEIKQIEGIKDAVFEKLKDRIRV